MQTHGFEADLFHREKPVWKFLMRMEFSDLLPEIRLFKSYSSLTRPAYIDDKELLAFEREDMKRRSTLHEKVEKETTGNDDAHLWG